ncbi:dual oxidase 1 isoform X2 [Strongylocentrotus purpuratus]|uniref:NAD(P)H oxidase (H2O2-forming) n=1 Tax=Strongylocentrotus purpuratus TaxID=7668 RepID=A0A7M7N6T8_STRPU|nr:dual oxidase 1 isoform X2 [Strongylocentrotus purpuratus]
MTPRDLRGPICVGLLLCMIALCSGLTTVAAPATNATTPATNATTPATNATTPATNATTDNATETTTATQPDNTTTAQTTSSTDPPGTTTAPPVTTPADEDEPIVNDNELLRSIGAFKDDSHSEPEGYDGWYNNLAHPDWGGAELPLTRRLPVSYADGVYAMAGKDRPNPMSISKATMQGETGQRSHLRRTALMTFFGQQVVEEILDAQRGGCPREYENIKIPDGHEYLKEKEGISIMPFVRSRYSFNTGYSPNVPREQLNEITPWFDGGLVYGTTKAWADALRSFKDGRLADNGEIGGEPQFPEQNTLGLPMANPPNPIAEGAARLQRSERFFKLGNPRGNENPFLLTFGVLWFRWHNYWADKFKAETDWEDERIFNEARKWVIATYQSVVFYEWLPGYLNLNENETAEVEYSGYKGYIHPGITHEFQSAAMRFGHTLVPPGVMRRNEQCVFRTSTMKSSGFTEDQAEFDSSLGNHGVRTCNSFWNPQHSVREHDIEEFLLGMASQVTEREDNIITEDLQRRVFGPLEFSRRDLMALNIQRGRDHGLPDYNTARVSLGMDRRETFESINNASAHADGVETFIKSDVLDNLARVYENDIDKVDIWAGGLLETTSNGPGELFRFIILDQFVRSRDADRFWFENNVSGQFTNDQIDFIKKVKLWDIIVACTNINGSSLQKDPFHYTPDDPCYDQHPFEGENRTISENDMENCTKLQTFDYFEGSEVSYALSFLALGIWVVGVVAVLLILAHIRQHSIQEARKLQHRKTRSRDPSSLKTYAAAEWCGKKEGSRQVQVKLGPGKKIRITNERGNKILRTVDLTHYTKVGLLVSPDGKRRHLVVKFDREYDIVLKFSDPDSRLEFISDFESFLGSEEVGVGRERQEIGEKELLKVAVTKEHRTKLLEKFFLMAFSQAFKLDFDPENLESLNNKETKDILECELTKTEFADVLTMKPDSLFVEQMFELVDQDNSGSISFREFLDVIVVFAKGQPEDKLKLMFNMYDIDRSGHLSREEFRQMLKSMMEMVSASVEETDLDKLIHDMFQNAGLGDKEALSLDDFIAVMAEHKDELNNAKLDIAGNIPQIAGQKDAGPPGRGAATVIRRGNLNSRARQTIIRAYKDRDQASTKANGAAKGAGGSGGGVRKRAQSKSVRVETVQQEEAKTQSSKAYNTVVRFFENNRLQIFYVVLYLLVLAGVFIERAYYYSVEREFAGLRRIAGFGVSVTRGAASAMMFTYSSLLVTMCRNTITKLRETFLHRYVPFDSALNMHKLIAMLALFFSIMHTIGHSINFYHISTQTADDLTCYFRDFFHRSHELPKFHYWAWGTITGFTGILLVMVCTVIYTFAFQYARRRVFNLFWFTHNMWIIYFILMFLHGSGRLVQPPFTHYFALGPIVLFTLDKLVSISRKKAEIAVTRAELLPSDVTMLEFKRPQGFEYKSGQWVRIACKTLSSSEYHPFTLTSAPHEENLSLHIRAIGPWTMNLRATYDPNVVREHPLPKLFLDGPYGEGHQDWYQYEVAVLVGGGIGVTPFASILKDIVNKSTIGARVTCKKVYFIWVTRTQKHYEWLTDIIRDVEDNDTNDLVSVHIFVTQFFQKFDLRTTMLYICERHFQKISNRSLFTGLKSITHFGRPQFTSFLQSLEDEHPGVGKIGVFSCGPPGMTGGVEQACVDLNKFDGAAFIHHYENF